LDAPPPICSSLNILTSINDILPVALVTWEDGE
jgi:hypothetical protein